ncbi:class I tRNA ligase family protein [Chitinophaga sp. CF118]|uniref:class I tRNA ligase family protein n=1 Tax=Chitinophaga sp. CF118 TaxID=1884367 RepID=UPI000B7C8287|nr:class I tRNA ligase family protein [Chitinophaga sp. CF118]
MLIIPSPPTPNGGLHLGHLAGPYLRSDLYKRFLQVRNSDVKMIFGIDAFDLYMAFDAKAKGKEEVALINENYDKIKTDLSDADIAVDDLINPLDYTKELEDIADTFYSLVSGHTRHLKKISYVIRNPGEPAVLPPMIQSTCLICQSSMSGNVCEGCGGTFNIFDLKECTIDSELLLPAEEDCICLEIDGWDDILTSTLSSQPIVKKVWEGVSDYYKGLKYINLLHRYDWGIKVKYEGIYYKLNTYANRFILNQIYGARYQTLTNSDSNPYSRGTDVKIVSFFGKDNILSNLFNKFHFVQALSEFKMEDLFIVNDFYLLEGKKFSTSRNHKITCKELMTSYGVGSDEIRFYLTLTSPSNNETNFTKQGFEECLSTVINPLKETINTSEIDVHSSDFNISDFIRNAGSAFFEKQNVIMDAGNFVPEKNIELIHEWLDVRNSIDADSDRVFWMKLMLLFLYPIMPFYTSEIWRKRFDHQEMSFECINNYV